MTPLPTKMDAQGRVPVNGYSVLNVLLGTEEGAAMSVLQFAIGNPLDTISREARCSAAVPPPYQVIVTWGGFSLTFEAADSNPDSPRTLVAWTYGVSVDTGPEIVLEDGSAPATSFDDLKLRYPEGVITAGMWPGSKMFVLPDGTSYLGYDAVEVVFAGNLAFCD
jgi:hypothetical protein